MPPALEDVQLHWWRIHFSFDFRMSPVLERRFGGEDLGSGEVVCFGESGCSCVFVLGLFLDMLVSDEGVEIVSQEVELGRRRRDDRGRRRRSTFVPIRSSP